REGMGRVLVQRRFNDRLEQRHPEPIR
ncbi:ribonucleoside-diphosphate reductase 1 subunit beta, partial [Vibrio parahaemolyticus EKP-021]